MVGHVDKYLIFPRRLKSVLRTQEPDPIYFRVIDHSNAVYLSSVPQNSKTKRLVTCHDLIALRSSKNEFPKKPEFQQLEKDYKTGSPSHWEKPTHTHAIHLSPKDLNRIIPHSIGRSEIIHLGVSPKATGQKVKNELPFDPRCTKYLLHVGSSAWYKNRKAVLTAFSQLMNHSQFQTVDLVFVGPSLQKEELTEKTKTWIEKNKRRIRILNHLDESNLRKLYEHARAVFPSLIEGFGWPPLEANAMGCPVITTHRSN